MDLGCERWFGDDSSILTFTVHFITFFLITYLATPGLSCGTRDLVPTALGVQSVTHGPPGKSLHFISSQMLSLMWQKVPVSGPEFGDPWEKGCEHSLQGPGDEVNTWNKPRRKAGLRLVTWHITQWVYRASGRQVDSGNIIPFFQEKPKMQIFMWNFPIFNTLKKAKQNMSAD